MGNYRGNGKWRTASGLALWGSAIQTIFNLIGLTLVMYLAYNLIDILLSGILPSMASMSLDYYEKTFAGFIGGAFVCFVIAFLGYLLYLVGVCLFTGAQESDNSKIKTRNIMLAELIAPVLTILFYVGYYISPRILGLILDHYFATSVALCALSLAAVIIPLVEFKSLTKEETWSEKAQKGADDLKFSYSCILWGWGVIILALGIAAIAVYSSYAKLTSGSFAGTDKYGNTIQGITSLAQEVQNLAGAIKMIVMVASICVFIFILLQTCYRISGWNKVKLGGNEVIRQFTNRKTSSSGGGRFCHKCGDELPAESYFCPACGTAVAVAAASDEPQTETVSEGISDGTAQDTSTQSNNATPTYEEYQDEDSEKCKKWILWGGIAAGIIAIVALIWAFWGSSAKLKPNANVFVDSSVVFKSIEDGIGIETIDGIEYGTPVETRASEFDNGGIWIKVAFEKDGKVKEGYMAKSDLINPEDHAILNKAGLSDSEIRSGMPINIERLALLSALKSSEGNWSIERLESSGQTHPNTTRLTVRGVSPSEDCLGLILTNDDEPEKKMFFLFSTPDIYSQGNMREPVYLYSEPVGNDKYAAYDVTYNKKKNRYTVDYTVRYYTDDFLYEGSAIDYEPEEASTEEATTIENIWDGPITLEGYVDDKYPIKMDFTLHEDGSVSGTVRYLKYDVPMQLEGTFTDGGEYRNISLDESSESKITGNFTGRYDGKVFSGIWVNVGGTKKMPFKVER